jgi:hypothetical protein
VKRKAKARPVAKPLRSVRREELLAQAKITQSFEPVAQRYAVHKLILESVLSRACTSVEILEAAYHDPQGHRYWEFWLFEPLPIYQFAELLALDIAATNGVSVLDRYLFQLFERLRAAAEAGETWFIGDTSPLITETWSSLALHNSALAVRPREAIAWMCQNPNARHLVPGTPAQMAGSIGNPLPAARPAVADVRRRGPRATKLEQTKEKMRCDIREGRQTATTLNDILEKNLASSYGVSRETARKARNAVLSEIVARQIATNDK